jgi:CheY-like chemotaxis protein
MKIACVDDSHSILDCYRLTLRSDHEVVTYSDPEVFLEEVRHIQPDLVLLDLIMPYICGADVCIMLKADPETKNIPVVFCTGMQGEEYQILTEKCGADGHIEKGDLKTLLEAIKQWETN